MNTDIIQKHNKLYDEAYSLLKGLVHLDGNPEPSIGFFAKRKLNRSIKLFREVLEINPKNWAASVFTAKAYQSLGNNELALNSLMVAWEHCDGNPSVAKEIGMTAGQLGRHDVVISVLRPLCEHGNNDAGLLINFGLSLLFTGMLDSAKAQFESAMKVEPNNPMNVKLVKTTDMIIEKGLKRPANERELLLLLG